MQIKETSNLSVRGSIENTAAEELVMLAHSAGVASGASRAFSASVRRSSDDLGGRAASRWVEIPLVGGDGEISGVLCHTASRLNAHSVHQPKMIGTVEDATQFVVHDINNLFAVIAGGLRLLECHRDAACQKAIVGKMQEAITRGASLSRQLLETSRGHPNTSNGFVEGKRFAVMAASLHQALDPDIAVHTEIARDLWDCNADQEELYFALLNLCRNSADAMPNGGAITVAARNVETFGGTGAIEIVVADDGEGMSEEVLSRALEPYFTTKAAGRGTGLGLAQVQRFAQERGGTVGIESEQGGGTVVRLFLPCVQPTGRSVSMIGREIAYEPTADGGVFHIVDAGKDASTQ